MKTPSTTTTTTTTAATDPARLAAALRNCDSLASEACTNIEALMRAVRLLVREFADSGQQGPRSGSCWAISMPCLAWRRGSPKN